MKIAVYGASGFTGGFAVAELRRRGLTPVLVGRDEDRLRGVAAGAETRVAALDDPGALVATFADCAAVVNCAGPFALWGEPVVRAAIAAGSHYVDTTGEQGYAHRFLETFGPDAERAGVTAVPAMADDGGPGDLIAALAAARVGAVAEVLIADLRTAEGGATRGTARSMAAAAGLPALEYADGGWRSSRGGGPSTLTLHGEVVAVTEFALPGVATIPRHVRAGRVRGATRVEVAELFASLTPEVVDSVPEVLDEQGRKGDWLMLAEVVGEDGSRARGWVSGPDPYRLTGVIAVEGACRLAAGGVRAGALTPAQAFDPGDFLDSLAGEGVRWQVVYPFS